MESVEGVEQDQIHVRRSNWIWVRFEDEDGLTVDQMIQQLKTKLANYCLVLLVGSRAKEDRVWWSVRRLVKMARSARAAKPAKIKTKYVKFFSNNREQQKAKIQTWKIHFFCIQICTPKHERAENPFSENHALSPPHFRKFDCFFDCCRHIPKIIPKFGMQNTQRVAIRVDRSLALSLSAMLHLYPSHACRICYFKCFVLPEFLYASNAYAPYLCTCSPGLSSSSSVWKGSFKRALRAVPYVKCPTVTLLALSKFFRK